MAHITEVAPHVLRITTFAEQINLHFSQCIVRNDEPLRLHTALR